MSKDMNESTRVCHKLHGYGEIVKTTEDKVYVSFNGKQLIFGYPDAFEKGWLTVVESRTSKETAGNVPSGDHKDIREIILDASDHIEHTTIFGALNAAVGTDYTGWMKATWPSVYTSLPFRIWFPKLAEKKNGELVAAAFDCVNTISDDWNEVVYDDLKNGYVEGGEKYDGCTLIFAKESKRSPYIFRGAFVEDFEKSSPNHYVHKRIGTRVKLIGQPANEIELLDDFRKLTADPASVPTELTEKDIRHRILAVKINQRYEEGMDEQAKYNAIRGIWRISRNSVDDVEYVFGVYKSRIVGVYKPSKWFVCKDAKDMLPRPDIVLTAKNENRLFFIDESFEAGLPMDENERFYFGKSIAKIQMNQSTQNPVTYLGEKE